MTRTRHDIVAGDRPSGGPPGLRAAVGGARPRASTAAALKPTLYVREAGDTTAISVHDLHQGAIGDCFLIAAIGELALTHPSAIGGMIHARADGGETVTLYTDRLGNPPWFGTTSFRPVQVTVRNDFPSYAVNGLAGQAEAAGQKEIWPRVLEKAFATLFGGYGAISDGGYPVVAMEALTGHAATWMSPASLTAPMLRNLTAIGDLITMDTANTASLPFNLIGGHAYMYEGLSAGAGGPMVRLGNPWGFDQPALIPLAQLSQGIVQVDVGRFA